MTARRGGPLSSWTGARMWFTALVARSRRPAPGDRAPLPPRPRRGGVTGQYRPLYEYLRDRHANRVVLTFGEIESLVGFRLPTAAREATGWWSDDGAEAADAWSRADRSASVNLLSEVVIYERHEPHASAAEAQTAKSRR